ncbi:MAG: DNA primase [Gammaproteobacteria bacterium]
MSGRIPQEFIDDLLVRVDIVDLIDSHVPLKKTGSNFTARCPFHAEKTPSFSVSQKKQFFYCFGCGASGNAISFLMDYSHLDFVEAVEDLAAFAGISVPRESSAAQSAAKKDDLSDLYEVMNQAALYYAAQLKSGEGRRRAVDYLKARGVSGDVAKRYMLGYAPEGWSGLKDRFDRKSLTAAGLLVERNEGASYDRFRGRIMFPIRDKRARVVGFGARVLDDSLPKYLNSPETPIFSKGREVYGLYELLQKSARPERILVVEGYMDVVALAQYGIHYSVAALGTSTSKAHFELLFRFTSELVFCFDGDKAGRQAAWRAMEPAFPCMKDGRRVRIMLLPEGHDPDSLIRAEGVEGFMARIAAASTLSDYFFGQLVADVELENLEGRAQLLHEARKYLDQLPAGEFRGLMHEELERLVGRNKLDDSGIAAKLNSGRQAVAQAVGSRRLSLAQFVIALLLQNPELVDVVEQKCINWEELELSGYESFNDFIKLLLEREPKNTSVALEMFRGRKEEKWVKKLAFMELSIPVEGVRAELSDALDRLIVQARKEGVAKLLAKKERGALAQEEQSRLKTMLANLTKS